MATTTVDAYLEAKVAQVAAITNGSDLAFNWVERRPDIDVDDLLKINRWPKAVITDFGGELNVFNASLWERLMAITIVVHRPRDPSRAARDLSQLGELLVADLKHNRDDSAIKLVADSDEVAESVGNTRLYMKTYLFAYEIELA